MGLFFGKKKVDLTKELRQGSLNVLKTVLDEACKPSGSTGIGLMAHAFGADQDIGLVAADLKERVLKEKVSAEDVDKLIELINPLIEPLEKKAEKEEAKPGELLDLVSYSNLVENLKIIREKL